MTNFIPGQTVYCRFTRQAFTVLHSDGVLVSLRFADSDETSTRIIGELTSMTPPEEEPPQPIDDGSCDPLYGQRIDSADMGEC
jgi:hypothetical protein